MEKIRFIDFFGGIGGIRLGLKKANTLTQPQNGKSQKGWDRTTRVGGVQLCSRLNSAFRCAWANDNDKYACQIYRKHFGEVCEGDIRAVETDAIPEHDLLCAGFPCQSFSIAGKRRGFEDTRGTLFFEICRVIRAKRPSYLLLENVKGLLSHDGGATFHVILKSLDELGYDCQWQVLNSKDFGVPQNRERVFIVGHTRGKPRPKVFPLGEAEQVGEPDNWAYAIDSNIGKGVRGNRRRTMIVQAIRAEHHNIADVHFIPEGGKIRRLTPLECERLQGFPDGWTASGVDKNGKKIQISDTQRYKCLGNAVTVNVIEAIGRRLLEELL